MLRLSRFACVLCLGTVAATAQGQVLAPRTLVNPIGGFAIDVSPEYEITTTMAGIQYIGLNTTSLGSLANPVYQFTMAKARPEECAQAMAQAVGQITPGATVKVNQTKTAGEWQFTGETPTDGGTMASLWLFRPGEGLSYGIGVTGYSQVIMAHREEIPLVVRSCRLVPRPALRAARENTENAFTVTMPADWQYKGLIFRDQTCPGYGVWQANSPDGTVGCFDLKPGQALLPYFTVQDVAGNSLLRIVQSGVPTVQNLRVERVTNLPRSSAALVEMIQFLGGASAQPPRGDKSIVDYLGTVNGTPVRLRLYASFFFRPFDAMPTGPGAEYWYLWGLWAPVNRFEALADLAHGVHGSFKSNPQWIAMQRKVVQEVLGYRTKVFEKAAAAWDGYIRGGGGAPTDPKTGKPLDVPAGTEPYVNNAGDVQMVPIGTAPPPGYTKMDPGQGQG